VAELALADVAASEISMVLRSTRSDVIPRGLFEQLSSVGSFPMARLGRVLVAGPAMDVFEAADSVAGALVELGLSPGEAREYEEKLLAGRVMVAVAIGALDRRRRQESNATLSTLRAQAARRRLGDHLRLHARR
jgi:hypothetical protein